MLSLLAIASLSAPLVAARAVQPQIIAPRAVTPIKSTFASLEACASLPPVYSCENTTEIVNSCCVASPGGLILATQFWDTYTGREDDGQLLPEDSWTIHGLWPDYCDGKYPGYCTFDLQYGSVPTQSQVTGPLLNQTLPSDWKNKSVEAVLRQFGRNDLLSYSHGFWVNQGDTNDNLWGHEFAKHATCTSTFDPVCYADYKEGMDVVDYVQATIRAFKQYPSFQMLSAFGIVPSNTTTYSLEQIEAAFVAQTGAKPFIGCGRDLEGNRTILNELWFNAHVLGTPQYGQYKAVDTPAKSSCSNVTGAIHYYERTPSSVVSKYN